MLFHDSRRNTRTDADGNIVLLEDQNRELWNRFAINEGAALLASALQNGAAGTRYGIEAQIASIHATSPNWPRIVALYGELMNIAPSPVVELNQAVSIAMVDGPEAGLIRLAETGTLGTVWRITICCQRHWQDFWINWGRWKRSCRTLSPGQSVLRAMMQSAAFYKPGFPLYQNSKCCLGALHGAVKCIPLHRGSAGQANQSQQIGPPQRLSHSGPCIVIDLLFHHGAVDIVRTEPQRNLRNRGSQHHPIGFDVRNVVQHQPCDGDVFQIVESRRLRHV